MGFTESRFGELTEIRDERMRGKDNQWVRPHPGPFVWNQIEKSQGSFSWDKSDQYVVYAQENNQTILATIWPYANWEQKLCKRKKGRSPFGKHFAKYLSKPCSMENYKTFLLALVDRYDGDGNNDMPGLTKPITYWEIMNEPEFKMFFKGNFVRGGRSVARCPKPHFYLKFIRFFFDMTQYFSRVFSIF